MSEQPAHPYPYPFPYEPRCPGDAYGVYVPGKTITASGLWKWWDEIQEEPLDAGLREAAERAKAEREARQLS